MQKFLSQFLWLVSTSRNIVVVVVCGILAYAFHVEGEDGPFVLTGVPTYHSILIHFLTGNTNVCFAFFLSPPGTVKGGLPSFHIPFYGAVDGNKTYSFSEVSSNLGSAILVVPLLCILENISLAKVFGICFIYQV